MKLIRIIGIREDRVEKIEVELDKIGMIEIDDKVIFKESDGVL